MTLTPEDLQAIEAVVDKVVDRKFEEKFEPAFNKAFAAAFEPAFNKAFEKAFEPAFNKHFLMAFENIIVPYVDAKTDEVRSELQAFREETSRNFDLVHRRLDSMTPLSTHLNLERRVTTLEGVVKS